MNTLFSRYPALASRLPYLPDAQLPTSLEKLEESAMSARPADIWVKRDDLTSPVYGGNKVRKLAFLLAAAKAANYKRVITFGGAGSNHALATAMAAQALGLGCTNILGPQHNAYSVRRNLLASLRAGARLVACPWRETAAATRREFWRATEEDGMFPALIPPGGSSPLGMLGFVDAALEMAEQYASMGEKAPEVIYVASGTMGTCVGLALGLAAAGLTTRVEAVRVTVAPYTSREHARALFRSANDLLSAYSADFPEYPFPEDRFHIRDDFFGEEYALYTSASVEAVRCARENFGLILEGTYTGKAFAALIHDQAAGRLEGERVLFWNTHNSRDLTAFTEGVDYQKLPPMLHGYFESPVQPLEQ